MRKLLLCLICVALCFTAAACNGPGENEDKDMTLAENYDFGAPSSWTGTEIAAYDLGDAILEAYPYDDHYDWGQSIIYDEGIYKMWWCRQSPHDTVWYAESNDLKNWTNEQKILKVDTDSQWIKMHLGKPTVLKVGGLYIMYFEAPATLNGYIETDNNVLRATSTDGINWEYYTAGTGSAYPVIRMTDSQMRNGYYGIGQPSALYKDGVYYVYYTYSVGEGDKMYMSTSTDGINFSQGVMVFDRAACGVKYNALTQKFMMAFERTNSGISNIYYMESSDGVSFTYSSMAQAPLNQNLLSKNVKLVRGYADFIGNGHGVVNTHTVYVAFMEGKIAESGDWRAHSNTWDIHIAAFNPKEFANRTMVLPNGRILNDTTVRRYEAKHVEYEMPLWYKLNPVQQPPVLDGAMGDAYASADTLSVSRAAYVQGCVPTKSSAALKLLYDSEKLYGYAEITDKDVRADNYLTLVIDEKRTSSKMDASISILRLYSDGRIYYADGAKSEIPGALAIFNQVEGGWTVEFSIPWRFPTHIVRGRDIGLDVFYEDNYEDRWPGRLAWNDYTLSSLTNPKNLGDAELR